MRTSAFLLIAILAVGCQRNPAQMAENSYRDPGCPALPARGGASVRGDLVHNRESARAIAQIIITNFYSPAERKDSSGVAIVDLGKSWGATETLRRGVYGSGLTFQIDKCTSAIEHFSANSE